MSLLSDSYINKLDECEKKGFIISIKLLNLSVCVYLQKTTTALMRLLCII